MKVKTFYEPVFETTVLFMTDTTPTEITDYLKKKKYDENFDKDFYHTTAGSVTFLDHTDNKGVKTRQYLVIVEAKDGFYTLIHETHHLTTHILNDRGVPINEHNDEIAAYLQTYWFKQMWRFMNDLVVTLKHN